MIANARVRHRLSRSYWLFLLVGAAIIPGTRIAAEEKPITARHKLHAAVLQRDRELANWQSVSFGLGKSADDRRDEATAHQRYFSARGQVEVALARLSEAADEDDGDDDDGDDDEDEDEDEKKIRSADLPKAVAKTLRRESKGGEVEEIERCKERGKVVYEFEVEYETQAGELVYEITIAENGVLLSKVLESEEDEDDADEEDEEDD